MNFSEFSLGVRRTVFPEGEAENLVATHKKWIRDALIDMQQKVECLQTKHYEYVPQAATLYSCGASVFDAPKGFIKGLYTIQGADHCSKVYYLPVSKEEMECLLRSDCCSSSCHEEPYGFYLTDDGYLPYPDLPMGMMYSDSYSDKTSRSSCGYFTVFDNQVWIYPHLNSDETAVLEWEGIKRTWEDLETVEFDREAELGVEYWLESQSARKENGDMDGFSVGRQLYSDHVGKLIWQCRKERRIPKRKACYSGSCGGTWCGSLCGSSSSASSSTPVSSTTATLSNIRTVNTIADLRALSGSSLGGGVFVLGMDVKYDGQGGLYSYDSTNSDADDGISTIEPDSGSGRWKKLL